MNDIDGIGDHARRMVAEAKPLVAKPCECGATPEVEFMAGNFGQRIISCRKCKTGSVIRLSTENAIIEWNADNLVYKNGEYVYGRS